MTNEMKTEMAIFFLLTLSLATIWYYAWVKPSDEMRYQIMDCMVDIEDDDGLHFIILPCYRSLEDMRVFSP